MSPVLLRLAFLTLLFTQMPGCTLLRPRPKTRPAVAAAPLLVGTITLVNEDAHFVLIDSGMNPGATSGATLKTRSADGESGELKIADIRKRPFAIADIVKGAPRVGDQVFQEITPPVATAR